MRKIFLIFFLLFGFVSCKNKGIHQRLKVAYDPLFTDGHIGMRSGNVQGFLNEVIDLFKEEGILITKVAVGPDNVNFALQSGEVDLSFSTLNPSDQQKQWVDFSKPLLEMGPVIVVAETFSGKVANHFMGRIMGVGTNAGSQISIVQTIPGVIIETFVNIALGYEDLAMNRIDGLLDLHFDAYYTTKNLYKGKLKIATRPLNDFAYRFVGKKGRHKMVLELIEKKQRAIRKLREKWDLPN